MVFTHVTLTRTTDLRPKSSDKQNEIISDKQKKDNYPEHFKYHLFQELLDQMLIFFKN